MADPDLRALLESWMIHLRAERKAEGTVRLYATGVRTFLAWCDRQGRPAMLDRATVAAFVAELLNDGREAATARARQLACAASPPGWSRRASWTPTRWTG